MNAVVTRHVGRGHENPFNVLVTSPRHRDGVLSDRRRGVDLRAAAGPLSDEGRSGALSGTTQGLLIGKQHSVAKGGIKFRPEPHALKV